MWNVTAEHDIVLPCNENITSAHRDIGKAIDMFGDKLKLRQQGKKPGELATMMHSLSFSDGQGNTETYTKWIHYSIIGERGQTDHKHTL